MNNKQKLSKRQVEVITLIALGYSDKQIGTKLGISYGTVRGHIGKITAKLGAQNRTQAVLNYKLQNKEWLE